VPLGLWERQRAAQNIAVAIIVDTTSNQHRRIQYLATLAHVLALGVENEVAITAQTPGSSCLEYDIESGGRPGDLRGTDIHVAQIVDDILHLARGSALRVHLGDRQQQGAFRA
jgi:hypothetical protein